MQNFGELKLNSQRLAQREDDSDYATKIGVWLQLSHKLLAEIYDFWLELQAIYNFTTVDGTGDYPLPNNFDKPFRLYDLTNDKKINPDVEEVYFDSNIANIADAVEGPPDKYRLYGMEGVRVPISTSGDTVKAKSSSTEDNGTVVRVRGYVDSAHLIEDYESIILTGTSFKAGTKTFYKITHLSKSANTTGYITLANSTGTTLDTLAPNERVSRHIIMKLGLMDDAYSMRLLYKKTVSEMVNDYDYPFIDADRYLLFDAYGYALKQEKDDNKANFAWQKAQEALQILLSKQGTRLGTDYQHKITNVWAQSHRS